MRLADAKTPPILEMGNFVPAKGRMSASMRLLKILHQSARRWGAGWECLSGMQTVWEALKAGQAAIATIQALGLCRLWHRKTASSAVSVCFTNRDAVANRFSPNMEGPFILWPDYRGFGGRKN